MIVPIFFSNGNSERVTKITGHQKHVHVLVEPSPKCKNIFVSGNTSELIPGGSGVEVVLQNISRRHIILEPHTEVDMVTAANIFPSVQIPDKQDLKENEDVQCKSVQADLSEVEIKQEEAASEDMCQKVDLSGMVDYGTVWFTSLDLKSGYWQVEMEEDCKALTAFTIRPLGFYKCERIPFGLTNAHATCQCLMQSCLGNLHL